VLLAPVPARSTWYHFCKRARFPQGVLGRTSLTAFDDEGDRPPLDAMTTSLTSTRGPKNPERSFGVSVGGALCLLAAVATWRHHSYGAAIAGMVGVPLLALGLTVPRALAWPSALWWRLVHVLGYVNSRILLTVMFSAIIVPLNAFWRLTGKDPLAQRKGSSSGWSPYPPRYRDRRHYSRMY
jgi:hypothetical protein